MEAFISMAASQLGLDESRIRQATSVILGFLGKEAKGNDFEALLSALPGDAAALAQQGQAAAASSGGGIMGGLLKGLGSRLGKGGAAIELLGQLKAAGLQPGEAGSFAGLFSKFASQEAGPETFERVLSQAPQLKKLMGGLGR